ncbi:30S ribosomal protein S20 [Candidatus Microgenomates bacterium]|nr:30S ribosomal protein S20 [Candidatus Microgenomates bacterium]
MPVTKSAKRALRKSLRKKARNLKTREGYKKVLKTTRKTGKDLSSAFSALDRAAKRGVIHKRKAARLKSRLSKLIKPAATPKPSKPKASKKK